MNPIELGTRPLSIEDVLSIARGEARLVLTAPVRRRLCESVETLDRLLEQGTPVYGVTTGFGASCDVDVAEADRQALAQHLVAYHGCGTGALFDETACRAIVVARLACLARGHSGVRPELLDLLIRLLDAGVVPAIPSEGSVGASGDLTPLSYVAAVLLGEREVYYRGRVETANEHFTRLGLAPIALRPKESLSLMNGTSAMSGLACLAFDRARRLARWAAALSALCRDAIAGHAEHFDARLFELKAHPGQAAAARWIREDTGRSPTPANTPIQDRYSLRCAPHVIGVCLDFLPLARQWIETEIDSVNDNPILDGERVLHGGHFYGGHICQAMDTLKTSVANLADLLDRQLLLVCDPTTNRGLPANLVFESRPAHHGFKAMQITTSALAAEAAKASMPASVFSRSTENHNQDKVSLGTIAARDCLRVLELSETVAAICTLGMVQALELRGLEHSGSRGLELTRAVREHIPPLRGDRRMDLEIREILARHERRELPIGTIDFG